MDYFSGREFLTSTTSSNLMSPSKSINAVNPTVLVLGGSYSGLHAAEVLAQKLPRNWSVTLVERNTHFNHVYSFPRSAVTGQSHWNFIPYSGKIKKLNQATPSSIAEQLANDLSLSSSTNSTPSTPPNLSISSHRIQFINATVTKIVEGKVFLDRMVHLENNPLPLHEPALNLSSSSSSSTQSDPLDISSSVVTDSAYGSSLPNSPVKLSNPIPSNLTHHQSPDSNSIEQINQPPPTSPSPRNFQIGWDFLVYALGSHMPTPLQLPEDLPRSKTTGVQFLEAQQSAIANAQKIVIVGGGALGIQYACDIAHHYQLLGCPKKVTLIHSRSTFLPTFKPEMDIKVKEALKSFDVEVILGERVNLTKLKDDIQAQKMKKISSIMVESVSTEKKKWEADLVFVCTGQVPNSSLMAKFCPLAVAGGMTYSGSTGLIRVNRALQISPSALGPSPIETPTGEPLTCDCGLTSLKKINTSRENDSNLNPIWSRVFAIGDCIDGFGAIKAGHVGWNQAEIAAGNILKLIHLSQSTGSDVSHIHESQLDAYLPSPPMIKLTLGLNRVISQLRKSDNSDEVEVTEKITEFSPVNRSDISKSMWNRYDIPDHDMLDGWA